MSLTPADLQKVVDAIDRSTDVQRKIKTRLIFIDLWLWMIAVSASIISSVVIVGFL